MKITTPSTRPRKGAAHLEWVPFPGGYVPCTASLNEGSAATKIRLKSLPLYPYVPPPLSLCGTDEKKVMEFLFSLAGFLKKIRTFDFSILFFSLFVVFGNDFQVNNVTTTDITLFS